MITLQLLHVVVVQYYLLHDKDTIIFMGNNVLPLMISKTRNCATFQLLHY